MEEKIQELRKLKDEVYGPRWGEEFERVISALELEIAERYTELPVDADGLPIHVGDRLECHANGYDGAFTVFAIGNETVIGNHDIEWITRNPSNWFHVASFCTHVKLRTLEDVLADFSIKVLNSGHQRGLNSTMAICDCAAEIRELLEKHNDC